MAEENLKREISGKENIRKLIFHLSRAAKKLERKSGKGITEDSRKFVIKEKIEELEENYGSKKGDWIKQKLKDSYLNSRHHYGRELRMGVKNVIALEEIKGQIDDAKKIYQRLKGKKGSDKKKLEDIKRVLRALEDEFYAMKRYR